MGEFGTLAAIIGVIILIIVVFQKVGQWWIGTSTIIEQNEKILDYLSAINKELKKANSNQDT